jgi:hypothetical protein
LPKFKYDKSKAEEYQLAITTSLGNLWVADSIGHLGANGLANLLQQCVGVAAKSTFGNKFSRGSYRERHCHKPWFDADYCTTKCELRLWLKANPNSHAAKHQESKLIKKENNFLGNYKELNICVCLLRCFRFGKSAFVLEKVSTKGTCYGQYQCNYAFGRFPRTSCLIFATHMGMNQSLNSNN